MFNIEKTTEYKAVEELDRMDKISTSSLQQLMRGVALANNLFWNGEVSAEIKIQMLGTKALSVFQAQEATENLIQALNPDYIKLGIPEGYEITWNEDGSGSITYTQPVLSNEENIV